jgi:Zn-dependent metalloprotease
VAAIAAGVTLSAVALATALPSGSPDPVALSVPAQPDIAPAVDASAAARLAGKPPAMAKPPRGALPAGAAIRELRTSGGGIVITPEGSITTVTAKPGTALATNGPEAFLQRYAAAFGLTDAHTLAKSTVQTLPGGDTVTRYQQVAGGVPVLGGEILVTTHGRRVRSAVAEATVLNPAGTNAKTGSSAATTTAIASAAKHLGLDPAALRGGGAKLWLYDPTLIGAPGRASLRPTWSVMVTDSTGAEAATVLVDALDGSVRLTIGEHQEARNRLVCDLNSKPVDLNVRTNYRCSNGSLLATQSTTRREGGPTSSVAEVNKSYDMLGATYDWYKANFGIDSYDDAGAQLRATVQACYRSVTGYTLCPYPNAFWEGTQFVFGKGFAVDDVVAHEYTHAITEWSSHLMYAYQSGAINEALSDIMGELVDQSYTATGEATPALNWQVGEDLPGGAIRSMSNPSLYGQPSCVGCDYWDKDPEYWDNGGVHTNSGPANYAAYLIAAGANGALGNPKSAQLWFRVMHVLPSGADYATLGAALTSSCAQLIGFYGFTQADCTVVSSAVTTTLMTSGAQTLGTTEITKVALCNASSAQPIDTLYFDGFEKAGTWPRTSTYYWLDIPSAEAQYQYANTGKGSLNGWTPNGGGNGTTATMPTAVSVPSTGTTYLHLSDSALTASSTARIYLEMSVNGGSWTPPSGLTFDGGFNLTGPLPQLKGYSDQRVNLTPLAGKQVKFRFRLATSGTEFFDFYIDDFRIYQCAQRPSAPTGFAYLSGSTATVGGLTTAYLPSGQTLDHYELSYSPTIEGAATTTSSTGFTIDNVTNADYKVMVRAVSSTGAMSDWTTLRMASTPPVNCQSPEYPSWLWGSRSMDMCLARTTPPRR